VLEVPTPRTSAEFPLRIARTRAGRGAIGMTICPGKQGPSLTGRPWRRDLEADLEQILDARYETVVTLMEWNELRKYGVAHMKFSAARIGLNWIHFPIVDGNVPSDEMRQEWRDTSKKLCSDLNSLGNVLIHCLGGLGRTGTVASMLMQDLGVGAEESMEEIRKVRPGAIENELQEEFVRNYRDWRAA
jgi:ADP-ribosyl-[dinitrogen reductase] hydrolase